MPYSTGQEPMVGDPVSDQNQRSGFVTHINPSGVRHFGLSRFQEPALVLHQTELTAIPVVVIVVTISIMVAVSAVIPITVPIPIMVVLEPPTISFPVAVVKLISLIVRADPPCSFIRRSCPISFVPAIPAVHGVPVAVNPLPLRPWPGRSNVNNSGWRWRPDSDPN